MIAAREGLICSVCRVDFQWRELDVEVRDWNEHYGIPLARFVWVWRCPECGTDLRFDPFSPPPLVYHCPPKERVS